MRLNPAFGFFYTLFKVYMTVVHVGLGIEDMVPQLQYQNQNDTLTIIKMFFFSIELKKPNSNASVFNLVLTQSSRTETFSD